METIFVTNEALIVSVKCDSLLGNKLYQISDSVCEGKSCVDELSNFNGVLITAIICGTILLIAYWIYLFYKEKKASKSDDKQSVSDTKEKYDIKMKEAIYQELKLYRSQLANFMEKRAITKESKCVDKEEIEYTSHSFDDDNSKMYIAKLNEYIKELSSKLQD